MICQWRADQLFAEAEGWGQWLICETLTNHDILGYPSSTTVLSVDHQVCFLVSIFGKRSDLPFFTQEWWQNTKHSCTTLGMGRSLSVVSYLQVTWWTFGQWKGRKICIEWYYLFALWSTTWHFFHPIDPKVRAKMAVIVNKVYCIWRYTWHLKEWYPGDPGWMYQKKNLGVKNICICFSHLVFWRQYRH